MANTAFAKPHIGKALKDREQGAPTLAAVHRSRAAKYALCASDYVRGRAQRAVPHARCLRPCTQLWHESARGTPATCVTSRPSDVRRCANGAAGVAALLRVHLTCWRREARVLHLTRDALIAWALAQYATDPSGPQVNEASSARRRRDRSLVFMAWMIFVVGA